MLVKLLLHLRKTFQKNPQYASSTEILDNLPVHKTFLPGCNFLSSMYFCSVGLHAFTEVEAELTSLALLSIIFTLGCSLVVYADKVENHLPVTF